VVAISQCHDPGYLATVPWRGGEPTPITSNGCAISVGNPNPPGYTRPDASPDGRTLLAIRRVDSSACCPDFVTLNADGSDITPVPVPSEDVTFDPSGPSFAPNGRSFAFESDDLWSVSLDGNDRRRIEEHWPCRRRSCPTYEDPRWSPDGKLIAVKVEATSRSGLWLIRARNGKPVRRIARGRAFEHDWSPDGRSIVYRTNYEHDQVEGGASGGNVYVVSRDGKSRRRVVHRENIAETEPTWSPNGRWIAWISLKPTPGDVAFDVRPSLWRVRTRGGRPVKIGDLPEPAVEEGFYVPPYLTWLSRPG
jgi:Tol biopolymer transport system component